MASLIEEVVSQQRAALAARESRAVEDIRAAYKEAARAIGQTLGGYRSVIRKAEAAGENVSAEWLFQEARLENALREVRARLDFFQGTASEVAKSLSREAYEMGAVHAVRLAEMTVIADVAGVNWRALENAQAALSAASPLNALMAAISPEAVDIMRREMIRGIAIGRNPREAAERLAEEIDGLTRRRAETIARTEAIRSYSEATSQIFKQNADVLRGWRWMAAKTPATCILCLALDGEEFPIEEPMRRHPSCRCVKVPLTNTDFGLEPIANTTGREYFDDLSRAEKEKRLGKQKTAMYLAGEIDLVDVVKFKENPIWGASPAARRISELKAMKAARDLPSQKGTPISGYKAPKARTLEDLESAPQRIAARAAESKAVKGRVPISGQVAKNPEYRAMAPKSLKGFGSQIQEVNLAALVSPIESVSLKRVMDYIERAGDGPDLPIVVSDSGRLYIHTTDSAARIEAKRLLGLSKTTVRIYESGQWGSLAALTNLRARLLALGIQKLMEMYERLKRPQ